MTTESNRRTSGAWWRRPSASVLTAIGGGLCHLGRLRPAQRSLTAAVAVLDGDPSLRAQRLATLNRLGVVLKTAGRYDDAESRYRQVLSALRMLPTPPADLLAVTHHNLAGLAYARGDHEQAEALIRRALALRQGSESLADGRAADEGLLGAVLAAQGRDDEARDILNRVLATFERTCGLDDYEVAVVLHNLAALDRRRNPPHAQRLYERALAIKQRRLGPHHPEVGVILNNLAALHHQQGNHDIAADLSTHAQRILRRGYGASHPATRACAENERRFNGLPRR